MAKMRKGILHSLLIFGAAGSVLASSGLRTELGSRIRGPRNPAHVSPRQTEDEKSKAEQIKEVFQTAWNGYYEFAFPNDELLPVTNGSSNDFQAWATTLVDSFDTAIIMGLDDIISKSLDYIPTIDYTRGLDDSAASLFETNIRHLGGLLSAYDLLTGPFANLTQGRTEDVNALLTQAQTLADTLKYAFDTPTGIPYNGLFINNKSTDGEVINNIAQVGTLILEWTRLSDLTGNSEYTELAQKAETYVLNPVNPDLGEPYPGLVGQLLNLTTGEFTSGLGGWIGGVDSYYEYLIKAYVYDPTRFTLYRDRWIAAADSSITYLTSHPSSRPELTYQGIHNNTDIVTIGQYLQGFTGGNYILGGLALREPRYIEYGLSLMDGYAAQYNQTPTGLNPARIAWDPPANSSTAQQAQSAVPANQTDFYAAAGFWVRDASYALTPEIVESWYYAYRATGEAKYQDYAWASFAALRGVTRVGSGFSAVTDVTVAGGGEFTDEQPSFALAETLKYLYLIFAGDVSVGVGTGEGPDGQEWVFNTEAHPVRVLRNGTSAGAKRRL